MTARPRKTGAPHVARICSESGASFLIALAFALVVGLVAALAVSAATVNAERATAANRADDQAYYAVVAALDSAESLVKRDICAITVSIDADKNATTSLGPDELGLGAWARDQVGAMASGSSASPKNVVVSASDMGGADLPDVLLTFTMNTSGVYVRSCVDVWGSSPAPEDEAALKADLVERSPYSEFLTRQLASASASSTTLPRTVAWAPVEAGE